MVEAKSDVIVPVSPETAFAAVADLDNAGWLPAVRGVRHIGGPKGAVGARYEVEAGFVGRHLRGVLVCRELTPPRRLVMALEEGLDLTITAEVTPTTGGSRVEIAARYSVRGPLAAAVERASQGAARRETARACEQLAARLGRKADQPRSA